MAADVAVIAELFDRVGDEVDDVCVAEGGDETVALAFGDDGLEGAWRSKSVDGYGVMEVMIDDLQVPFSTIVRISCVMIHS